METPENVSFSVLLGRGEQGERYNVGVLGRNATTLDLKQFRTQVEGRDQRLQVKSPNYLAYFGQRFN